MLLDASEAVIHQGLFMDKVMKLGRTAETRFPDNPFAHSTYLVNRSIPPFLWVGNHKSGNFSYSLSLPSCVFLITWVQPC